MIHKIKYATRQFSLLLLIVSAICLTVIRLFLMGVDDYKHDLESKVLELTNITIEIGELRARLRGINPEVVLQNIRVISDQDSTNSAIKLKEVRLGIDLMQLAFKQNVLQSSWLTLVGAELSIVRKEDGRISIAGLNEREGEQPLWLLNGGRYEVLKSEITWLDEQRNASSVKFNVVDLVITNDSDKDSHEMHFVSNLPDKYGGFLRVSLAVQGSVFEVDDINGMLYIEGTNIHLAALMTGEKPYGINLESGTGSFKKWGIVEKSSLIAISGQLAVNDVVINRNKQTYDIKSLTTEFNGFNKNDVWQFGVKDFLLQTNKNKWPAASFDLSANKKSNQFSASVVKLDIGELSEIAQFFAPLNKEQKMMVSNAGIKGQLNDFYIYADTDSKNYAVNGVFENIAATTPKLELVNLTGRVSGTNHKGSLAFFTQDGELFFPDLFRKAFVIKKLIGSVSWLQSVDSWLINSENLVFNTEHFQTDNNLSLVLSKNDAPAFMDLQSSFFNLDINHVSHYYPVSIMKKDVVKWLDNAFVSGKVEKGDLLVVGELNQFPFINGQGVFEVLFDVNDLELHYSPGWPNINYMASEILFYKDGVSIDVSHAEVNKLTLSKAFLEIPEFKKSNYLLFQGVVNGDIANALDFIQQSPIHQSVDGVLEAITPKGLTQIDLDLNIALSDDVLTQVDVKAHLNNAALNIKSIDMDISRLSGDLMVTNKGVSAKLLKAKAMGYPIVANIESNDAKTIIGIAGKTNIKQLQKQFSFINDELVKEAQMTGSSAYKVLMDLPKDGDQAGELKVTMDLAEIAMKLPEDLAKTVEQDKVLTVSMQLGEQDLLPLRVNYNEQLKAAMTIDKQYNKTVSVNIVYGVGNADFSDKNGINVQIEQDSFNASEWSKFLQGADDKDKDKSDLFLNAISLTTQQLFWKEKQLGAIEVAMQRLNKQWQGSLSSSIAKGAFVIPAEQTRQEKIKLELAYLNLTNLIKLLSEMEGMDIDTEDLPLIQVFSEKLWWEKVNLGRLNIETEKLLNGVQFKHIDITSKRQKLEIKANWVNTDQGGITDISGRFESEKMGRFLRKMGLTAEIKETEATIRFFGSWKGSPYSFSLQTVNADIDLELRDGRISSIEPGFGRLLGLLAIEQWGKRVMFDFRDVYKKGLSFNSITGHFNLHAGKMNTNNLMVDAVPARVAIDGQADLITSTLDYQMYIVPKSSSAIPIAGTIVGGIAGAIASIFADDYKEGYFFGSTYKIDGSWDDIKVTPLHEQDGVLKKTWTGLTDFSWMRRSK